MASDSSPPVTALGDERRRDARRVVVAVAELADGDDVMSVLLRDISTSGAMFFVNRHLDVGERWEVTLRFTIDGCERVIQRSSEIVRSELLAAERMGMWIRRIGVQFASPLAEEDDDLALLAAAARTLPVR
jgi:hypothetical protein